MFEGLVRPTGRQAAGRYVEGLLLDSERKSIEPMAERLAADPSQVSALRSTLRLTRPRRSPRTSQRVVFAPPVDLDRLGHEAL